MQSTGRTIPAPGRTRRLRVEVEVVEGSPVPAVRGFLVLKRLESDQHVINAIDDELLLSEKEFERRWGDYVKKTFYTTD